jgi:hypothetical protein
LVISPPPPPTLTHLDDVGFIEDTLADGLEFLHVSQQLTCKVALGVDDAERRYVHEIVFEILQVERFQILLGFLSPDSRKTTKKKVGN